MQVKRACRHTTHRQTDGRHMKYKAAQDEDDVSSSPLLKSRQQFLASAKPQKVEKNAVTVNKFDILCMMVLLSHIIM